MEINRLFQSQVESQELPEIFERGEGGGRNLTS